MSNYVYIISDYGEYGATNLCATLDRSKLEKMVEDNWPTDQSQMPRTWQASAYPKWQQHMASWRSEAIASLRKLLEKTDEELASQQSGWECHSGWGGMQLHVARLK